MYGSHRHRWQYQSVDDARRRRASMRDRARVSRRTGLVAEVLEVRRLLATATVTVVPSSSSPIYGDSLHFTAAVSGSNPGGSTPAGAGPFLLRSYQSVDDARRRRASMRDRARVSRRTGLVAEVLEVRRLLATATVTVVPSSSSPTYGNSLNFTATVSGPIAGGSTPTGAIQFLL